MATTTTTKTSAPTSTASVGKNVSSLSTSAIQSAVGAKSDGVYGPQTTSSVKAFQTAHGLVADGIVGPKTAAAIAAAGKSGGGSGTSSTSGSPTAVVGATGAVNDVNKNIKTSLTTAKSDMANQQLAINQTKDGIKSAQQALNDKLKDVQGYVPLAIDGIRGPKTKAAEQMAVNYTPPAAPLTPEQEAAKKITDQLDPGNKYVYDIQGNQTQVPESSPLQPGQFDTKVTPGNSISISGGNRIVQLSNGQYAITDMQGNYMGNADATQFSDAQHAEETLDNLNKAANGEMPLKPNQVAQIDAIKAQYADLIEQTQKEYANRTGVETIRQNLYGMGNTSVGANEITEVINTGAKKVAGLVSAMAGDVAKMTAAFDADNLNNLKTAYDAFHSNQTAIQDEIDKMQTRMDAERDRKQKEKELADKAVQDKIEFAEKVREFNTSEARQSHEFASNQALEREKMNQKTTTNEVPPEVVDAVIKNPALINMYSYTMKGKVLNAVIAASAGTNTNIGAKILNAKLNFDGSESSVKDATKKRTIMGASESAATNTMEMAINKLTAMQSNPTILNKIDSPKARNAILNLKKDWGGDPDVVEYTNYLVDSLNEYGKVISGQTTGAAVTDASRGEAEKILNAGYNIDQLNSAFTSMKNAMSARTKGLDDAIAEATIKGIGGDSAVNPDPNSFSQQDVFNSMFPDTSNPESDPMSIFNNFQFNP